MTRGKGMTRRAFLRRGLGLAAFWASAPLSREALADYDPRLPTRTLGRTGLEVPILGLGGSELGRLPEAQGVALVEAAVEAGITYIDTASSYWDSERWVGRALKGMDRTRVVLATKTLERSRDGARWEIERSLKRLGTDRLDLLQIHAVNTPGVLRRVTSDDGSLRAALEFKEAGHVSHIGVTGHRRPEVLVEALKAYPFETALVPINPVGSRLYDFAKPMTEAARGHGVGLIAMKVLADGALGSYVGECLRYALSQPVSCAVVGVRSAREVEANVRAAKAFRGMSPPEMTALEEKVSSMADLGVLWWKR